jgi:hypothetical protein
VDWYYLKLLSVVPVFHVCTFVVSAFIGGNALLHGLINWLAVAVFMVLSRLVYLHVSNNRMPAFLKERPAAVGIFYFGWYLAACIIGALIAPFADTLANTEFSGTYSPEQYLGLVIFIHVLALTAIADFLDYKREGKK